MAIVSVEGVGKWEYTASGLSSRYALYGDEAKSPTAQRFVVPLNEWFALFEQAQLAHRCVTQAPVQTSACGEVADRIARLVGEAQSSGMIDIGGVTIDQRIVDQLENAVRDAKACLQGSIEADRSVEARAAADAQRRYAQAVQSMTGGTMKLPAPPQGVRSSREAMRAAVMDRENKNLIRPGDSLMRPLAPKLPLRTTEAAASPPTASPTTSSGIGWVIGALALGALSLL